MDSLGSPLTPCISLYVPGIPSGWNVAFVANSCESNMCA